MTTHHPHPTKRLGLALKRAAAWAGRCQGRLIKWQVSKGVPFKAAKVFVLLLNVAVAGLFLYLFAWVFAVIALLLVFSVALANNESVHEHGTEAIDLTKSKYFSDDDPRNSVFYHPDAHNDIDPRFDQNLD